MKTTTENILAAINRRNIKEFPGCDALGLNPDVAYDKLIADAIIYCVQAVMWFNEPELMGAIGAIENIPGFAKIDTMQKYGVIDLEDVFNAIRRLDK